MRPLFCSYATKLYRPDLEDLVDTLEAHGLDYHAELVPDRGGWLKNCARKPEFLYRQLRWTRPCVWLDADARVLAPPALFDHLVSDTDYDVAVHRFRGTQTASGTVYFSGSPHSRQALCAWQIECERHPGELDQVCLERALLQVEGLRVFDLPPEYCWIYDLSPPAYPDAGPPVIEHRQSSRRFRHVSH